MVVKSGLREQLVVCAMELLMEGGIEAVGLRAVTRRAGVSHGAPRRYFPTLESLLSEVAARGFGELAQQIGQVDDTLPVDRQLERIARIYTDFGIRRRSLFELMFRHDLLEGSGNDLRDHSRPLFALLVGMLRDAEDPQSAAIELWTNLHGLATLAGTRALDIVAEGVDTDRVAARIVATHLAGITARGTSARNSTSTTKSPSSGP
ncbi:TetR/AcrR family transcriptional regulator [Rhodococcus sp. NPDC058521]|uniref:TetR/AcrR family transcriptional regulator n=1 Tax=Rhodococcus sp. NPDC058521 TaxID=3346536 RepID=UPI00365A7E01